MAASDLPDELLDRCRRDHQAWLRGDGSGYALPEDGTILGAVGSWAPGGAVTAELQQAVASGFSAGEGEVEVLNGGVDGNLAWVTLIERGRVVLDRRDGPRRWDLRVTEVFRRTLKGWQRVHRHADPLVDLHDPATMADLLVDG